MGRDQLYTVLHDIPIWYSYRYQIQFAHEYSVWQALPRNVLINEYGWMYKNEPLMSHWLCFEPKTMIEIFFCKLLWSWILSLPGTAWTSLCFLHLLAPKELNRQLKHINSSFFLFSQFLVIQIISKSIKYFNWKHNQNCAIQLLSIVWDKLTQ